MKNVQMTVDKGILTIKIDLAKDYGPSKSGKTIIVATTEGNAQVPGAPNDSIRVGLNVYKLR